MQTKPEKESPLGYLSETHVTVDPVHLCSLRHRPGVHIRQQVCCTSDYDGVRPQGQRQADDGEKVLRVVIRLCSTKDETRGLAKHSNQLVCGNSYSRCMQMLMFNHAEGPQTLATRCGSYRGCYFKLMSGAYMLTAAKQREY